MFQPLIKEMRKFLKFVLPNNIIGITLFPFGIYIKFGWLGNVKVKKHESIHWYQQMEMFVAGLIISVLGVLISLLTHASWIWYPILMVFPFLFFYIWYVIEWLVKTIIHLKGAYRDISFEREAYGCEKIIDYLKNRKLFAWFKFLFNT